MKIWLRVALFTAALVAINATVYVVLTTNLTNHVYPVDGDSIGIPLAETWLASEYAAVGLLVLAIVPRTRLFFSPSTFGITRLCLSALFFGVIYFSVIGFFILWGVDLYMPHHFLIAAACFLSASVVAALAMLDIRRLFSGRSRQQIS